MCLRFRLITVTHIEYNLVSKKIYLTLINTNNTFGVFESEFTIDGNNLSLSSVSGENNDIKIEIDASNYVPDGNTFSLAYKPSHYAY